MTKRRQLMNTAATLEQSLRRNKSRDLFFNIGIYVGFSVFSVLVIYPFYYILINSFNGNLFAGTAFIWPDVVSLENYKAALKDKSIIRSLFISILRLVTGATLCIALTSTAAFALRKRNLKIRWAYLIMFTIPMFFGGGLIPNFLILKTLGLIDTFFVYILPPAWNFFYIIIFMSCFNDIDDSMEESAIIDGANHLTVYLRIYVPMSVPVIVTILLFSGVFHWGAWFDSIYFIKRAELQTLAAFLVKIIQRAENLNMLSIKSFGDFESLHFLGVRFTTIVLAIVPVLAVYPFIQKYFIRGIRLGSIKG